MKMLAASLVVAALVAGCGGSSEAAHLENAVKAGHPDAICGKVGVMAFAGGRSNLYGCTWGADAGRHCAVWADGTAYDVTKTARALFKLQGNPSPC